MADDSFDSLRLLLMQDVLPVGLAIVERAKKGGASRLVEAFTNSSDPVQDLRVEGESAAKILRERLDQLSPGLGNPVMSVKVAVDDETTDLEEMQDKESLVQLLGRIEDRLEALDQYLQDDLDGSKDSV